MKAIITLEDDGDDLKINIKFDPPVQTSDKASSAAHEAASWFVYLLQNRRRVQAFERICKGVSIHTLEELKEGCLKGYLELHKGMVEG